MDSAFQNYSILIATDFDLEAFSRSGLAPNLYYGGWIIKREPYKPQELIKDINNQGIDVLIVEEDKVPKIIFDNCPGLKIVISMRGNPVNIDLEAAKEHGVLVLYAPGRNAQAVAELTICLMLDLLRKTSDSFLDIYCCSQRFYKLPDSHENQTFRYFETMENAKNYCCFSLFDDSGTYALYAP